MMLAIYLWPQLRRILGIRNNTRGMSTKPNSTSRTNNPLPRYLWPATWHQPRSHLRLRCIGLFRERKTTQIGLQNRRVYLPRNLTKTLKWHPHSTQNIYKQSDFQKGRQLQWTLIPRSTQQPFPHDCTKERVSPDWTNFPRRRWNVPLHQFQPPPRRGLPWLCKRNNEWRTLLDNRRDRSMGQTRTYPTVS